MTTSGTVRAFAASAAAVVLTVLLPACGEPTAETIVAKVGDAMTGNAVEIDDVRTVRVTMVYPDHAYPVVTEIRRPNCMRAEGVGSFVIVFDGQRGAYLERPPADDGSPRGPELIDAQYLKDFELDIAFVFPAFFDHPSEYLGREPVEGVDAHKLRVDLPLGIRTTYFVDATSFLPLKVVADVTVDSTEYHPGRVFGAWEETGGMKYPRTVRYWWVGEDVASAVVESVEVNPSLGDDLCTIPADLR